MFPYCNPPLDGNKVTVTFILSSPDTEAIAQTKDDVESEFIYPINTITLLSK